MNPAYLLLYGVCVTSAPVAAQIIIMAARSPERFFWGIGSGILVWGCVSAGFMLSLVRLGFWMTKRSPVRSGGAYSRAAIVGAIVGLLGAYPIGFLAFSTSLARSSGVGRPLGALLTGVYLALMFGGYMLRWQQREARGSETRLADLVTSTCTRTEISNAEDRQRLPACLSTAVERLVDRLRDDPGPEHADVERVVEPLRSCVSPG